MATNKMIAIKRQKQLDRIEDKLDELLALNAPVEIAIEIPEVLVKQPKAKSKKARV